MSADLWAYDDFKCDGAPCGGCCDTCPTKDEHLCYECRHYDDRRTLGVYGRCLLKEYTTGAADKACDDFEEVDT